MVVIADETMIVRIVPASSGYNDMVKLDSALYAGLIQSFSEIDNSLDVLIVDTAAGIGKSVVSMVRAAQEVVVVLTPDLKGPLFRTIARGTGQLSQNALPQANAHAMVRRRALAAGIKTLIGNHTFRATGITAYLKNGGTLENEAAMANHASTCTTQLYDRS
ncbi:hypothetical protein PS838_00239 [Pseudomonas fluorescens]|nr:hypothetical protein PS838_00239 [Pseudomonas fluorescens]